MIKNAIVIILTCISLGLLPFAYEGLVSRETVEVVSDDILSRVGEHILLPEDEKPSIANIENPNILLEANPTLYSDAEVGDKLIIYTDRVLIYRPSTDIIVTVSFLSL